MSIVEIIRDFNGWSWDITTSQMESKNINIIYQNLLMLLGNRFIQKWCADEDKEEVEETDIPNNEILGSKYNSHFGMTVEEMQENEEIDYIQKMQEKLEETCGKMNAQAFMKQFKKTMLVLRI